MTSPCDDSSRSSGERGYQRSASTTSDTPLRHVAALQEREPEDRLRDARPRHHSHHTRYLQPCAPDHAGERRQSDGGRAFIGYCCPTAAKAPGLMAGGLLRSPEFCVDLQEFLLVGAVGLEPTLLLRTRILSPVRLPIPPRPRAFCSSRCR